MARRRKQNRRIAKTASPVSRIELREVCKLVAVATVVIAGIFFVRSIEDLPIKSVIIQSALQNVKKDEIRYVASIYAQRGFFTVNLSKFEEQLEEIPWIYKAKIKRKWPSKLVIRIEEQTPLFRWADNKLLNSEAQTFSVDDIEKYKLLPKLHGQKGRERYLAGLYYQYNQRFKKLGLEIAMLEEDARYDKRITLSNGILISVGREHTTQQLERCLRSIKEFNEQERAAIASIDLRHSNGFAVRWNG